MQLPSPLREPMQKQLSKYILRAKVKAADVTAERTVLGVAGKDAAGLVQRAVGAVPSEVHQVASASGATVIKLPGDRYEIVARREESHALTASLASGAEKAGSDYWDWLDIRAGIATILPATQEAFVPQMLNLDLIGAVSLSKGCYPGQEIVSRMHYRGTLKQRMYLANVAGTPVAALATGGSLEWRDLTGGAGGRVGLQGPVGRVAAAPGTRELVAEVERPAHRGVERVEQEAEEAVVAPLPDLDPDGTEPVAEPADGLRERVEPLDAAERRRASRHRDREAEAGRSGRGPAVELLFRREPVEGRVQLDRVEPLGVEAEKVLRPRVGRIEPALPGRVREAGGAGVERYDPSCTS